MNERVVSKETVMPRRLRCETQKFGVKQVDQDFPREEINEADVSSVSPAFVRANDEGLTLETSASFISLRRKFDLQKLPNFTVPK